MDSSSYQTMIGSGAGAFMWIMYILAIAALILSIMALLKYLSKK